MNIKLKYEIELTAENADKIAAINKILLVETNALVSTDKIKHETVEKIKTKKIKTEIIPDDTASAAVTDATNVVTIENVVLTVDAVKTALKAFAQSADRESARLIMNSHGASALSELENCSQSQLKAMLAEITSKM